MNKRYHAVIYIFLLLTGACTEDFLDIKNLYDRSMEDFYKTPEDIEQALAGAYCALSVKDYSNNPFVVAEILSDDRLGGGGPDDLNLRKLDNFEMNEPDDFWDLYTRCYEGILRVNMIIQQFDKPDYEDLVARDRDLGEAYFLRALFYFRLSKLFGPTSLKLDPAPADLPRATPEEMYGQIGLDLKMSIELMPSDSFADMSSERNGHATKWAAQALLARVFLFYTGYYQKSDLLLADGTILSKQQVLTWIEECITSSGHALLSDFRNNWDYSKVNVNYPYAEENNLIWADGEPVNRETLFAIKYNAHGGYIPPYYPYYANRHVVCIGLRGQYYVPFGQGWGFGPINPQLWNSFEEGDLRREGSILNLNPGGTDADEGTVMDEYISVTSAGGQMHETRLWEKKYMPIYDLDEGGNIVSIYTLQFPSLTHNQLCNLQDDVLIRFADVLLMAAELGSSNAQVYVDHIRERAGLEPVPVSLEVIKTERRHELAFEGLRYFDLLRWHDAEEAFAVAADIPVLNQGLDTIYTVHFRPETGGFLYIPETEILRSEGGLVEQTPGWGM